MQQINLGEFVFYKYKLKDWEYKKDKFLQIYLKSHARKYGNVITNWNTNLENKNYLKNEIGKLINDDINLFLNKLSSNYIIESMWFQEYQNGMNHEIHDHGVGYSSIIYVDYNSKYHKPTTFVSNDADKTLYYPEVEEGDIIFFNSKYNHYASTNQSNFRRLICAFNLKKSVDLIDLIYN